MPSYVATNRKGQACTPHRYPDGRYRAARYISGDKNWKLKENYIPLTEAELPGAMADPGLYVRMSSEADPVGPAFFPTRSIRMRHP